ncbi:MAG: hypothetical protein ACP5GF_12505, partial [Thiomonas sp.]
RHRFDVGQGRADGGHPGGGHGGSELPGVRRAGAPGGAKGKRRRAAARAGRTAVCAGVAVSAGLPIHAEFFW